LQPPCHEQQQQQQQQQQRLIPIVILLGNHSQCLKKRLGCLPPQQQPQPQPSLLLHRSALPRCSEHHLWVPCAAAPVWHWPSNLMPPSETAERLLPARACRICCASTAPQHGGSALLQPRQRQHWSATKPWRQRIHVVSTPAPPCRMTPTSAMLHRCLAAPRPSHARVPSQ